MIIVTMENHVYRFGNEIRRQREGGPIGLSLTGEIADCYMINWDRQFLEKLKSLGIDPAIYERFKDDITILVKCLEAGLKFEHGSLIMDLEKQKVDQEKSDEEITMAIIKDIAESVDKMLEFTVDYPGNHKSKKMPVLDVEVSVNKDKQNKIEYEFYEKPTKKQKSSVK